MGKITILSKSSNNSYNYTDSEDKITDILTKMTQKR